MEDHSTTHHGEPSIHAMTTSACVWSSYAASISIPQRRHWMEPTKEQVGNLRSCSLLQRRLNNQFTLSHPLLTYYSTTECLRQACHVNECSGNLYFRSGYALSGVRHCSRRRVGRASSATRAANSVGWWAVVEILEGDSGLWTGEQI